jgi:hypothetical protein
MLLWIGRSSRSLHISLFALWWLNSCSRGYSRALVYAQLHG